MGSSQEILQTQREHEPKEEKSPLAIGLYLPQRVYTTDEMVQWNIRNPRKPNEVAFLTHEDLEGPTGVKQRHVATESETYAFMGASALQKALNGQTVDYIVASNSHPYGKNLATTLANEFGFGKIETMDAHAACSGLGFSFFWLHETKDYRIGEELQSLLQNGIKIKSLISEQKEVLFWILRVRNHFFQTVQPLLFLNTEKTFKPLPLKITPLRKTCRVLLECLLI